MATVRPDPTPVQKLLVLAGVVLVCWAAAILLAWGFVELVRWLVP